MLYKPREKSKELIILELLNKRMTLSKKDQQYLYNLQKGYEGEILFDSFTEKLQCHCLILNDLLFTINHTTFQIDALIIAHGKIYFYEIKNNEGDYYYEMDKLYKMPKLEIINPLHQLGRSESLLQQLLLAHGYKFAIDASVVFINPSFNMYQAPLDKPIIYPNQIKRYFKAFDAAYSHISEHHMKLADQLMALHQPESPFKQLPPYNYKRLRKGISCSRCHSFLINVERIKYVCQKCGHTEDVSHAVLRSIKEFKALFPNERLTTNTVHDWTKAGSKQRTRSILLKNFNKVGTHRWSYFE